MLSFGLKYNNDINAVKRKSSANGADFGCVEINIEYITGKTGDELLVCVQHVTQ